LRKNFIAQQSVAMAGLCSLRNYGPQRKTSGRRTIPSGRPLQTLAPVVNHPWQRASPIAAQLIPSLEENDASAPASWPGLTRLSGAFFLGKAQGIDSKDGQSFATQLDMKRISAVPHSNTVFRAILKLVPWASFDRLVKNHGTDDLVRGFTTKRQWLALLYGQLAGATSRRDIIAGLSRLRCGFIMRAARLLRVRPLRMPTAPAIARFPGSFHAYAGRRRAACAARSAMRCA
jgi:Domain of unknown function (DUF4372)